MRGIWLLGTLGLAGVAHAVDVDPYDPSASIPHDSGTPAVESPRLTGGGLSAGLLGHVGSDLVTRTGPDGELIRTVPHAAASTLYGGYTFEDKLRIDVLAPIYWHTRSVLGDGDGDTFRGAALGDVLVQTNIRIRENESGSFGFSVIPTLGIPTGRPKALLARGPHLKLRGAVGGEFNDRFGYAANLGFVLAPGSTFEGLAVGSSITASAGAWVRLEDQFRIGADYDASIGTSNAPGLQNVLGTGSLFAQATNDAGIGITAGVSRGFIVGVGAPRYRVFAALTYAKLVRDADDDTILDPDDACPLDPEDFDGFEDVEGCPDVDNDQDGILDIDDTCPDEAEDFDDFEDTDGCPDLDNDGDSLPDTADACMYQAGEATLAGCPDLDADGLADDAPAASWPGWAAVTEGGYAGAVPPMVDQCPADPGPEAFLGCPDTDDDLVPDYRDACPDVPRLQDEPPENSNGCPRKAFVSGDRIEITERVLFETGKSVIRGESFELLDSVVEALERYPQIQKIEIAGHTDNVGPERYNLNLSRRRAAAVSTYLQDKGISAERLTSEGYGETEPIANNFTDEGKQKNRRVEFRILEQEPFTEEVATDLGKDVGGITVKLPDGRMVPFVTLSVDGELTSPRAPVRNLLVPPGGHVVRVTDARSSLDYTEGVDVAAGSTVIVQVPADAMTESDGTWTPAQLDERPARTPSGQGVVPDTDVDSIPEGAPLALPVDDAPPGASEPEPEAPPESTDDAGGDEAMDLLPTADTPDAMDAGEADPPAEDAGSGAADDALDLLPTWGGTDEEPADSAPAGDPDAFPVQTGDGVEADPPVDGFDAPDGDAPTLGAPTEGSVSGPGFGTASGAAQGPGFGTPDVEEDPKEARKRAKAEAKAAKRAAKEAEKARKKAEKARRKAEKRGEAPPEPLVDPSTLTPSPAPTEEGGDGSDDEDTGGDDDPWSQD